MGLIPLNFMPNSSLQPISHSACMLMSGARKVFDSTPKLSRTKASLIRNAKMVKTNLLKACALALLEAHLSARINIVLVSTLSSDVDVEEKRRRNNSRRVWHCLAPAHMRLMNSEAATSYNNVALDKMRQIWQQKRTKLNWTKLNGTEGNWAERSGGK